MHRGEPQGDGGSGRQNPEHPGASTEHWADCNGTAATTKPEGPAGKGAGEAGPHASQRAGQALFFCQAAPRRVPRARMPWRSEGRVTDPNPVTVWCGGKTGHMARPRSTPAFACISKRTCAWEARERIGPKNKRIALLATSIREALGLATLE